MMMRRPFSVLPFLLSSLILFTGVAARASSFKVNIGELLLQNLQPGQTYDLQELLNMPYRATYDGVQEADVHFTPELPEGEHELKPGFEPIPDRSWLVVASTSMPIGAKGTVENNLKFVIPDDDRYLGKKYVVYLWVRTFNKGGGFTVGLGTKSRFLVTIASERASAADAAVRGQASLNFQLEPQESLTRKPLKVGKRHTLGRKTLGRDVVIVNNDSEPRTFTLEAIPSSEVVMTLPEGYEWPANPKDLTFKKELLVVKPKGRAVVPAFIQIPEDPALKGKKFFYLARVKPQVQGQGVASSVIARFLVETAP
jgi:hypothetical protein